MADLVDFSSFPPAEEKNFVPFERVMRENGKKANTLGYAVGGAMFVVVSLVCLTLYTPCTRYCERPPSTCSTDQQIADFKRTCWDACRSLEKQSNLPLTREVKDEATKKMETKNEQIDGSEFVEHLAACAFSGGGGTTCEGVTKIAEEKGLWCKKKD